MMPLHKALGSSVGKKVIMAVTGLALVGFLVTHLAGNLLLYSPNPGPFNKYASTLASYGPLLWVAEIGLALMALLHVVTAISLKLGHAAARPHGYKQWRSKGGHTLASPASRGMIYTGAVLLVFLVIHVIQFKFGTHYDGEYEGHAMRDLHKLVVETFQNPVWVGVYVAVMVFLGFHVRHGFWSAFQSLGAMNTRLTKPVHLLGLLIAITFAAGFLGIPLWIFFGGNS